jgi:nitrogen regulatory protein P-II 1
MKEIKACFRPQLVDQVVDALEKAGAKDLTVIRVDGFGPLADTATNEHHFVRKYNEKYSAVAKLELVCRDENAVRFAKVIHEKAHTGDHGDHRIFIGHLDEAINIRTGEFGVSAL